MAYRSIKAAQLGLDRSGFFQPQPFSTTTYYTKTRGSGMGDLSTLTTDIANGDIGAVITDLLPVAAIAGAGYLAYRFFFGGGSARRSRIAAARRKAAAIVASAKAD